MGLYLGKLTDWYMCFWSTFSVASFVKFTMPSIHAKALLWSSISLLWHISVALDKLALRSVGDSTCSIMYNSKALLSVGREDFNSHLDNNLRAGKNFFSGSLAKCSLTSALCISLAPSVQ